VAHLEVSSAKNLFREKEQEDVDFTPIGSLKRILAKKAGKVQRHLMGARKLRATTTSLCTS
jgi:hypothetical protein